jgi:hypothetical protein
VSLHEQVDPKILYFPLCMNVNKNMSRSSSIKDLRAGRLLSLISLGEELRAEGVVNQLSDQL